MASGRERLRELRDRNIKQVRFARARMWLSLLVSLTTRDRGNIPENIGNNILITNNMYITKNYLSSIIMIVELSIDTPVTLLGEMIVERLRKEGCNAVVDFTVKNSRKNVNLRDYGLESRIRLWNTTINNKFASPKDKQRAVRLLYTVDQVKEGHNLMDSRIFITLRAKNGTDLAQAETITYKFLSSIGAIFRPISMSISEYLNYSSLISDQRSKKTKGYPAIVNSPKTLSQLLPNSHSPGEGKGIYFGNNTINNSPFRLNFKEITVGRNIYVITNTGGGKTAMILNMASSALEEGFQGCFMDIKGNEFSSLVDSVGGATISLRESSTEYINTFRMLKEESSDKNAEIYFKERLNFSKLQMLILSGIKDQDKRMILEGFLDEFLNEMYISLGVKSDNRNTWKYTDDLNPYKVYDYLETFLNSNMKSKYQDILTYITNNIRMYYSRKGSKSYIFSKELQYKDLLERRAIRFDFGILEGTTYDPTIFRLKFEYMSRINGEFTTRNYDRGLYTFKVLEESQAVDEDLMRAYAREYTLRRAQNQTTVLIGNSVAALLYNKETTSIIETTTALLIGKLNKRTADLIIEHFDVDSKEEMIRTMSASNKYLRHFLFVNNMESRALAPIIKVNYEPGKKYKLLTPTKISRDL